MSKAKAPRVFVPLTKVDEEQRLVYGVITEEAQDKAGETMHYEKSKANFEKWSNDISKASNGLSKGNVRVMHQLKVGGKLTDISFNDDDKSIEVCAKVTSDEEWNNVLEGCYTGFSVGGSYGKKWTDGGVKYYEAKPNEVSLVDNPCVTGATFTMVKADGEEEVMQWDDEPVDGKLKFHKADGGDEAEDQAKEEAQPEADKSAIEKQIEKAAVVAAPSYTNDQLAEKCKELQKAANDGRDWMSFLDDARSALEAQLQKGDKSDDAEKKEDNEKSGKDKAKDNDAASDEDNDDDKDDDDRSVAKTTPAGVKQVWTTTDGQTFEKKSDAVTHETSLSKATQESDDDATKVTKSLGRIKDLLEKNDKEVVIEDEPEAPSILSFERIDDLHKAYLELETPRGEDAAPLLEKGMYTVSRFARMLGDVGDLARTIKAEGKLEGGDKTDSEVAGTLIKQLGSFGESFMDYSKQQIGELVAGLDTDLSPRACYDYYYRAVEADPENALAKNVCELIEAVEEDRDVAMEKLAKLAPEPVDTDETLQKVANLVTENEDLKKRFAEVLPTVELLEKRLKIVEETPMPRAPRGSILEKHADGSLSNGKTAEEQQAESMTAIQEMLKSKSPEEISVMLIKAAQQNPQKLTFASR